MATYDWQERHIIDLAGKEIALETKDLHVYYGTNESIKGIDMKFEKNKITALIGPLAVVRQEADTSEILASASVEDRTVARASLHYRLIPASADTSTARACARM